MKHKVWLFLILFCGLLLAISGVATMAQSGQVVEEPMSTGDLAAAVDEEEDLILSDARLCNGSPYLCDKLFSEVTFPGNHNAGSGSSGALKNCDGGSLQQCNRRNHGKSISEQLEFGIRYFDIDTRICKDSLHTCHNDGIGALISDMMDEFDTFLNLPENRNEVIVMTFGDQKGEGFKEGDRIAAGNIDGDEEGTDEIIYADRDNWLLIFDMHGSLVGDFPLDFEIWDGLAAGDVDGDGKAEIIHGSQDGNDIRIYDYDLGSGVSEDLPAIKRIDNETFDFKQYDGLAAADVDGDGTAEVIYGSRDSNKIHIFDLDPVEMVWKPLSVIGLNDFDKGDGLAAGNVDGDVNGTAEVIYGSHDKDKIQIYDYDALAEVWNPLPVIPLDSGKYEDNDGFTVGNVDDDDAEEIIHGRRGDNKVFIYDLGGNKREGFTLDFERGDGFTAGDLTGDGSAEIIHGDRADEIEIFAVDENDLDGTSLNDFIPLIIQGWLYDELKIWEPTEERLKDKELAIFKGDPALDWGVAPKLGDLVDANQRIVIFARNASGELQDIGVFSERDHIYDTWQTRDCSSVPWSCASVVADTKNKCTEANNEHPDKLVLVTVGCTHKGAFSNSEPCIKTLGRLCQGYLGESLNTCDDQLDEGIPNFIVADWTQNHLGSRNIVNVVKSFNLEPLNLTISTAVASEIGFEAYKNGRMLSAGVELNTQKLTGVELWKWVKLEGTGAGLEYGKKIYLQSKHSNFELDDSGDFEEFDGFTAGDVNGDGRAEIIHGDRNTDEITVYDKNGAVVDWFELAADFDEGDGLTAGDVDGLTEGGVKKSEIIHAVHDGDKNNWIMMFAMDGSKLYSFEIGDFEKWDGLAAGDVNGDGTAEIIHADRNTDEITIYDKDGNVVDWFELAADFDEGDGLAVGDVDGDETAEIIHAVHDGSMDNWIMMFAMDGSKLYSFKIGEFEKWDGLATGDVNGDGTAEILHASRGDDKVYVYNQYGIYGHEVHQDFAEGDSLTAGDVDGDGTAEIIHGDEDDWIQIFSTRGTLPNGHYLSSKGGNVGESKVLTNDEHWIIYPYDEDDDQPHLTVQSESVQEGDKICLYSAERGKYVRAAGGPDLEFQDHCRGDESFAVHAGWNDADLDLALDVGDNCLDLYNPDQVDYDGDGAGDACDEDDDNDGILDVDDPCPTNTSPTVNIAVDPVSISEGDIARNQVGGSDRDGQPITGVSAGTLETVNLEWNNWSFATSDGPDDSQDVLVTVSDDCEASDAAQASFALIVNNVAPKVTAGGDTIAENGLATVSGTITDPGYLDTFEVIIEWGEGRPVNYSYGAGTTSFSETHQYLDDNPSFTPADTYTIKGTITDDDRGSGTFETAVTVNNLNPVTSIDSITDETGESVRDDVRVVLMHTEIDLVASFTDVGTLDEHTGTIDWDDGNVVDLGSTTGSLSTANVFSESDNYTIQITVTDDDTGAGSTTTSITVVDAEGAISELISQLEELAGDTSLQPDAAAAINEALVELDGSNGGEAENGALDLLAKGNLNAALVKIEKAIKALETAEAADATLDLTSIKSLLALTAKSTVMTAIVEAEGFATKPNELRKIADAHDLVAEGDGLLAAQEYVDAVETYHEAAQEVQGIK